MKTALTIALGVFLTMPTLQAASHSSANYSVATDSLDAGGRHSTSASYTHDGSAGGIGGISTMPALGEVAKHGYLGQWYRMTGLTLSANPATVNEGTTRQVFASAALDDATLLRLAGSEVNWMVRDGPITSIAPSGLATAATVYQNTAATVRGSYLGAVGDLSLQVLNVASDDYGSYAGDGIRDDWQVQFFGVNSPNAGPNVDFDGDGQHNLFEYFAGTNPTQAASRFGHSIAPVPGQPSRKQVSFSPRLADRTYSVQYRNDVVSGSFVPLTDISITDNGQTRTVTDLSATSATRFYRVQITLP